MTKENIVSENEDEHHRRLYRRILSWALLGGAPILGLGLFLFVFFAEDSPAKRLYIERFAVLVGLPGAAVGSLFIVILLEQTHGKIEFEGLGFKFRGASGPVVLWMMCYLAIVASIRLLW